MEISNQLRRVLTNLGLWKGWAWSGWTALGVFLGVVGVYFSVAAARGLPPFQMPAPTATQAPSPTAPIPTKARLSPTPTIVPTPTATVRENQKEDVTQFLKEFNEIYNAGMELGIEFADEFFASFTKVCGPEFKKRVGSYSLILTGNKKDMEEISSHLETESWPTKIANAVKLEAEYLTVIQETIDLIEKICSTEIDIMMSAHLLSLNNYFRDAFVERLPRLQHELILYYNITSDTVGFDKDLKYAQEFERLYLENVFAFILSSIPDYDLVPNRTANNLWTEQPYSSENNAPLRLFNFTKVEKTRLIPS